MALSISIPTSAGSSIMATYHNIGSFYAIKLPDSVNGSNLGQVEYVLSSYASEADRGTGAAPLFSSRRLADQVALDSAILPQLYASLLSDPMFIGATNA